MLTPPFLFFDPEAELTITRGHLPHWDQQGSTYFITWRTADSIPKPVWEKWRRERGAWLRDHGINPELKDWRSHVELLPAPERREFRRFSRMLEDELDLCHGACVLRQPGLRSIVEASLHHFAGTRYLLGDFVVMPNHVHLLAGRMARDNMRRQVESWKKWTALEINKLLGLRGRIWQDEHFDHLVRNAEAFEKCRRYIVGNPVKAGLREGEYHYWRRPEETDQQDSGPQSPRGPHSPLCG